MNQNTKIKEAAPAAADNDQALLSQYGFSDLPEQFAMRDPGDGGLIQEREPCYLCRADGFYGVGVHGTFYAEGSIIVTGIVPNEHLEPLNRAAGLNFAKWRHRLPNNRAPIDVADMSEAAHMLAKDPRVTELSPDDYQAAVVKLAVAIKLKREGKDARDLPAMGHNFTSASGGTKSAPILGARMSDMTQRTGSNTPVHVAPGSKAGVRLAQPASAPALGGQR